ncbi:tail fiber protein [Xenorhabdus griffiniae]|uniref:tail fiber protein n=1 Tax=Xenorhabdus griffiniae TaxID=351672 RepID=UPI0030D05CED
MKEIRYSEKKQGQQTLSNEKSVGPETDKLKDKFKDGSIPLQTDFNQLIDIADIGRKACGQAPGQDGPGTGLKLDDNGTLNLKIGTIDNQDFSPLILEKDILSVDLGSGLINKSNGISVGQGNGITVNTNNVAVKSKNSTIKVEPTGISVGMGWGVTVGGDGLDIVGSDGITVSAKGVAVKPYNGIISNSSGVAVKPYNGINVDGNGVSVKAGNGITVNSNGVSIDPNNVLPRGMIVMFSGSSIPTGWALCDGTKETPNLIDRFILGGTITNIGGTNGKAATGQKNSKSFIVNNKENSTKTMDVRVNETKLSIDQIPKHKHTQGGGFTYNSGLRYNAEFNNSGLSNYRTIYNASGAEWTKSTSHDHYWPYTSETGGAKGHNHTASTTLPGHTHQVDIISPYYILAFIMKL